MTIDRDNSFVREWRRLQDEAWNISADHGFHEEPISENYGEKIALIHAEISETLEAIRDGNPPDCHIPEFFGVEAELADAVIRIMDFAASKNARVAEAIVAKMNYNRTRPYKHGKAF